MAEVETGGGASIGRDANAGRDVAGRDSSRREGGIHITNALSRGEDEDNPRRPQGGRDVDIQEQLKTITQLLDGDKFLGVRGLRNDLQDLARMIDQERRERVESQVAAQQERRELRKQIDSFGAALADLGAKMPTTRRAWYYEWAGPILGLVSVIMLFYMLSVLAP